MKSPLCHYLASAFALFLAVALTAAASLAAEDHGPTSLPRPTLAKPLLIGEWADIAVLKDDADYYLVHSSGWYRPAVFIWHSKDLKTWRPLRYAVKEFDAGAIWVTDLAKVDGHYYLFFLNSFSWQSGGYVATADSMEGPWTSPRPTGLHPDAVLAADDAGKRYLFSGSGYLTPLSGDGRALGAGLPTSPTARAGSETRAQRTPLTVERLQAADKPQRIYEGWMFPESWAVEMYPCIEGPKILRRGEWWHLIEAQGGTFGPSTSHMVVSARSRTPAGPWENSPHNPIIRTVSREEPWWSKGHGQLVEGPGGQWYCVLHGIMNGYRSLGRCTLIEPIEWTDDGWFKVPDRWPAGWEMPVRIEMPMSDEFDGNELGIQWQFYQQPDPKRFSLGSARRRSPDLADEGRPTVESCAGSETRAQHGDGVLTLQGRGEDPGSSFPLTIQPMHRAYEIETAVEVEGEATAGLMLFATPESYIGSGISKDGVVLRVQKGHQRYSWMKEPRIDRTRVELRIVNDQQDARFYYKDDAGGWQIVQPSMEVSQAVSTPSNLRPALFVCGKGEGRFEYFRYRPLESDEDRDRWLEATFRLSQEQGNKSHGTSALGPANQ